MHRLFSLSQFDDKKQSYENAKPKGGHLGLLCLAFGKKRKKDLVWIYWKRIYTYNELFNKQFIAFVNAVSTILSTALCGWQ